MKRSIYYLSTILFLIPAVTQASCLSKAAERWDVPEVILKAIILQESGGRVDAHNINRNGSHDYGLMQINTVNVKPLQSKGLINDPSMLMQPCINIHAGAYLLSLKFKKYGYSWLAVGSYHSETAKYRNEYANDIMQIVNNRLDGPHNKNSFSILSPSS